MIFRKISLESTSNNLACALQFFLCLFCARFALLKTGLLNQNLTKKGLKIESFLQKTQKFFCIFFSDPRLKSQILTPHPCPPPFENFLLKTLNSEEKPVKNQSTGDDFEIYRSGRENPDRFHLWMGPAKSMYTLHYHSSYKVLQLGLIFRIIIKTSTTPAVPRRSV